MNRNILIGIVVVVVVLAAGWFLMSGQISPTPAPSEQTTIPTPDTAIASTPPAGMMESTNSSATAQGVKEFTVTGSNFKFDIPEIRVKTGDTVKITFKNAQGFHDFVIDEFKVATKQANGPSEETVEFVADKAGTYEFYCSVGQHRAMGMKGNLIVE